MNTSDPSPGPVSHAGAPPGTPPPPRPGDDVDALLLRRVRDGADTALGTLYDRWGGAVYALAYKILGDADEAEDVVERVFTQVWSEADRYHPERGAVGSWIVLIARSRALDRLRRIRSRLRHEEAVEEVDETGTPPSAGSPLQEAVEGDRRERVGRALRGLPREQERVVRMSFFGGLSQSEIADELGLPLGTVKTRVRLALRKLRGALSPLEEN
jgi:RNA polymerase sigma-70 factor (ECF subfamily)